MWKLMRLLWCRFGGLSINFCVGQIIEFRTDNGDVYGMTLVYIVSHTWIGVFLLNWGGIWPPAMYLLNYLKWGHPIGWLWIIISPKLIGQLFRVLKSVWVLFLALEVYWGHKNEGLKKSKKYAHYGTAWYALYNQNQDRDQVYACNFTIRVFKAPQSE